MKSRTVALGRQQLVVGPALLRVDPSAIVASGVPDLLQGLRSNYTPPSRPEVDLDVQIEIALGSRTEEWPAAPPRFCFIPMSKGRYLDHERGR